MPGRCACPPPPCTRRRTSHLPDVDECKSTECNIEHGGLRTSLPIDWRGAVQNEPLELDHERVRHTLEPP
eukprot:3134818-Prymnesium_polylepis.1